MSEINKYSEDAKNFFLNEQNKKKKKKLEDKYGMTHMEDGENTSPEIMNEFLNYIESFEESWKNAETKKVKEIMNFPEFKKTEEIDPALLENEIDKVLKLYEKFHFQVSIIESNDVSELDFYKFLTEELTEYETNFIDVPGMNTNFIYEDFHPNDKLDAKDSIRYFLYSLKNRNEKDITTWLSDEPLYFNGNSLSQSEFINEIFNLIPQAVLESDIIFKKIEIGQNKVFVDFIIWHEVDTHSNEKEQITLNFLFVLEKSEFGMFNVKSVYLI
jgi:hypothetical protein